MIESLFDMLRDELLSCELFARWAELQATLEDSQEHYNGYKPHLNLGGMTPKEIRRSITSRSEEAALGP